jgi:hypothetical protein
MMETIKQKLQTLRNTLHNIQKVASGNGGLAQLAMKTNVHLTLTAPDGTVKAVRDVSNLVTNAGFAEVASLILADNPDSATAFDYIAIGTGSGQAATDTTLATEITTNGGERRGGANATGTTVTTSVTDDTAQLTTTFTFTGSFAVTESGVFNDASTGTMLCYQDFSAVNVASGDQLALTWKIQMS